VLTYWLLLEKKVPFLENLNNYLVVWSFGLFLPGKVGELGIIPILKKKYNIPYKFAVPAVIAPKIAMVAFLFSFLLVFGFVDDFFIFASIILLITLIIFFVFVFLFKKYLLNLITKNSILLDVYAHWKELKAIINIKNLILISFLTLCRFLSIVFFMYFIFIALGFTPEFFPLLIAISVSQIVAFLPITLNGLGVREATFTGVMVFSGCPLEISLGVLTISLFLNYSLAIILVIFWNTYTKKLNLNAQ
jgi:hypothetical protein